VPRGAGQEQYQSTAADWQLEVSSAAPEQREGALARPREERWRELRVRASRLRLSGANERPRADAERLAVHEVVELLRQVCPK
jgi:hypothetical protein